MFTHTSFFLGMILFLLPEWLVDGLFFIGKYTAFPSLKKPGASGQIFEVAHPCQLLIYPASILVLVILLVHQLSVLMYSMGDPFYTPSTKHKAVLGYHDSWTYYDGSLRIVDEPHRFWSVEIRERLRLKLIENGMVLGMCRMHEMSIPSLFIREFPRFFRSKWMYCPFQKVRYSCIFPIIFG